MIKSLLIVALVSSFALPAFGAGAPPTIDEINGCTFSVRASGAEYDLAGGSAKFDTQIEWTITKTGAETVAFSSVFGGMSFTARYVDGFLMQAVASGEVPPEDGSSMYLAASGQHGKFKLKGMLTVFSAGAGFNVLRVLKVSGSQIS